MPVCHRVICYVVGYFSYASMQYDWLVLKCIVLGNVTLQLGYCIASLF